MSSTEAYPPSDMRRDTDSQNWDRSGPDRSDRHRQSWLARAENWLDDKGKAAWIAAMIVGFVIFWPIGLALLAYMIWSKRMFSRSCNRGMSRHDGPFNRHSDRHHAWHAARAAMRPSGNATFDAYKSETLRRLEEEQSNFEAFLERLRDAKDKAEFDQFMDDRARKASNPDAGPAKSGPANSGPANSGPDNGDSAAA